jgi:tetratricopeptide (TPR) repeat protein
VAALALGSDASAQQDSLIRALIAFHTPAEKEAYARAMEAPTQENLIALFLHVDPSGVQVDPASVVERIAEFTEQHPRHTLGAAMKVKQLERLFEEVQGAFLTRYNENALFDDLFVNGDFNCLTASILFALLFDEYRLPYELRVRPEHVYVITAVDGTMVSVETTDPVSGVFAYDEKFKRQLLEQLLNAKILSRSQVDTLGADAALASVAEADSVVDIRGIAGALYFNSGLSEHQAGRQGTAIAQLAKGYGLFPFGPTRQTLLMAMAAKVDQSDLTDTADIELLGRTWAIANNDERGDGIVTIHERLLTASLVEHSDTALARKQTEILLRYVEQASVRDRIQFAYQLEFGRFLAIKKDFGGALEHFLLANAINPDHAQLSEWIVGALVEKLQRSPDRSAFIRNLDSLVELHPELKGLEAMRRCYMITYLIAAEDNFNIDRRQQAESHLSEFESLFVPDRSDLPVDAIASSYISGWRSWTRARRGDMARSCIARGQRIAPYNEELNRFSKYNTY